MGRMGISLFAGVINSAGAHLRRNRHGRRAPGGAWSLAIAVVDTHKPSDLGTDIKKFLFTEVE